MSPDDSTPRQSSRAPKRSAAAALTLGAAALLAACASSVPIRYYTLMGPAAADASAAAIIPPAASAPGSTASTPASDRGRAFTLAPVRVPARDDRASLVLSDATGRVSVLENEHWAAPLADELRGAFSAALTRRLAAPDVSAVPHAGVANLIELSIDVQRFDLEEGRTATLEAIWSARRGAAGSAAARSVLTCTARQREPVSGPGPASLVLAQQRAVEAVAARIAGAVDAWNGGAPSGCGGP